MGSLAVGYELVVARAYVDEKGFHLEFYCAETGRGRDYEIVAPLAIVLVMALLASTLSSGTPELLGPKILVQTLAVLAGTFSLKNKNWYRRSQYSQAQILDTLSYADSLQ